MFHRQLLTRSFPEGFARVRAHRALGHRTLLITGALDFIIEPVRPLFDDIVCAHMDVRNGLLTGHLTNLPPIGEARALVLADYAEEHNLSLEESVAYADSSSDLAMLEAVGFPVAVNPEARLAAIARRRGWHVEHWSKAQGGSHRALPFGPFDVKSPKAVIVSQESESQMSTLLFERSLPRFAAARIASSFGSGRGAGVGPLRLVEQDAPSLPGEGWVHVDPLLAGICGSDLSTLDGRSSRYFEEIVSFPFVPGHEVVGLLSADAIGADGSPSRPGHGWSSSPSSAARHAASILPARRARPGTSGIAAISLSGTSGPDLQTGFCADTGGGWSTTGLVAHASQLFAVPEGFSDADAVTIEPVACAVHAVFGAGIRDGDVVAVLGAGTLGLTVTAALAHLAATGRCPAPRALLVGRQVRPPATARPPVRGHRGAPGRPIAHGPCGDTPTRSPSAAWPARRRRCPEGLTW